MKENNNDTQDPNDSLLTQENKPYNLQSTSNEIQNIFKKIRKKNRENELKRNNMSEYGNIGSKSLLISDTNIISGNEDLCSKDLIVIFINIISFSCFYFSFILKLNYWLPVNFILYPMGLAQFCLYTFSSIITAGIIALIILKKVNGYHLLYMTLYYIFIFFINHYKYIGSSHFDQSFSVFYEFIFILIFSLCIFFIIYNGNISKDNILVTLFITRWHSYEKIKRSENESILNDKNLNFIFSNKKGNNIKSCLIIFSLFIFHIAIIILLKAKKDELFSCKNIDIGLNGTHILYKDSLKSQCHIKKPEGYCYMDYFKYYFDLTPINNINCSLRDPIIEKRNFLLNLEGVNENINYYKAKKFVFPYTNLDPKYSLKNQKDIETFGTLVNKDIYDMEDLYNIDKNKLEPEAVLDFSEENIYKGKYGELKINLVFNKTLSEERKKLENSNSLYDNIFMIYLDATSRAHFQRSFPKLSNLLKNFMKYDETNSKKVEAYQFMKYNSFAGATHYNIVPMFYGNSFQSKKGVNHIKYFKENGYVTGHEVDMCNKEQYDIVKDNQDEKEYIEWDHENIAYLCDGNYFEINSPYPSDKGAFDIKERCLYGHPVSYYMIEYAKQFWEKYKNNKKYFRMAFNYGHEKTGAVISKLDEPLYNFLFEFYDKGYFDNTAIFIVSKNNNIENYRINLLNNQQVFLTPYDVHDTLLHLIYGKSMVAGNIYASVDNKGNSVFNTINEEERNCKKYNEWVEPDFCCCTEK